MGSPRPPAVDVDAAVTVEGPITSGNGPIVGASNYDPGATGYVEEEFFLSGTATRFTSEEPLSADGKWTVEPFDDATYRTRIVVRRPADPRRANGVVLVEWLNVSAGFDAAPIWTYVAPYVHRTGATWVGVSAQRVGIEGGGNPLGAIRVLKSADPERYGSLTHPGDDYSYDLYSQVGATVWREAATVLGGIEPAMVVAMGESQSAMRLTSYANALAPIHDVYDAYLVHSRGGSAPNLLTEDGEAVVAAASPTRHRADLERPVLVVVAETDVAASGLGYAAARQDQTEWFRAWEMAGTAHADSYSLGIGDGDDGSGAADLAFFESMFDPPTSVYFGIISCGRPFNTGPHPYLVRSAIDELVTWARTESAPPVTDELELTDDLAEFLLDEQGNVLGGVRTPHVDVPVATLSGLGQTGESFCFLFGTTDPWTVDDLVALYGDRDSFLTLWDASVEETVERGHFLPEDAEQIRAAARAVPLP
jgi:hypothetical protein